MIHDNLAVKISVVIPVYNVEKYVIKAINSIINQTVQPYEIIIVDDGSTDGSSRLINENYHSLEFVRIIRTVNQGLGQARNVGARAASGDFIYYFDSDDLIKNDLIEKFHLFFKQHPDMDIFAFSAESFRDESGENQNQINAKLPYYRRRVDAIYSTGEDAFNALSSERTFYPNAWLYISRRQLLIEHQLSFKPIIHEDEDFTPRLFFAGGKVVITDDIFFLRRVRFGSIMHSKRSSENIVGYLNGIQSLELLLISSRNESSKFFLKERIINNIIHIISIKKESSIILSGEQEKKYEYFLGKYGNIFTKIASVNLFSYRLLKYLIRKLSF